MDYIILVKEIPDPDTVKFDDAGLADNEASLRISNPRDLNALEAALLMRQDGEKVIAISLSYQRDALKEVVGVGADHGYLIETADVNEWDSRTTALALSKMVEMLRSDGDIGEEYLILAGSEGADFDSGKTAVMVAEHLGIPHLVYCEEFSVDNGTITAKCNVVGGYATLSSPVPSILTITETANEPRYPALKRKLQAMRKEDFYTHIPLEDLGITPEERTSLLTSEVPPEKPGVKLFEEEDVEERVNSLLGAMRDDGKALGGSQ